MVPLCLCVLGIRGVVVPACSACNAAKGNKLYSAEAITGTQALRLTALFAAALADFSGPYRRLLASKIAARERIPTIHARGPPLGTIMEWIQAVEAELAKENEEEQECPKRQS